jgi:hypothetical protein
VLSYDESAISGGDGNGQRSQEQSEPPRLSFDSREDALDYARKLVEDSRRWLSVHNVNLRQRYEDARLEIAVECRTAPDAEQFHLIFRAIPDGRPHEMSELNVAEYGVVETKGSGVHRNRSDDLVFVGITEFVQSPQKVIPSLVWLKRHHQVEDVFRDLLGGARDSTLRFGYVVTEREMSMLTVLASSDADSKSGLVESGAKIVKRIEDNTWQFDWQRLCEFDLVRILGAIRVYVHESGVWIAVREGAGLPFECLNVTLGVVKAVP